MTKKKRSQEAPTITMRKKEYGYEKGSVQCEALPGYVSTESEFSDFYNLLHSNFISLMPKSYDQEPSYTFSVVRTKF